MKDFNTLSPQDFSCAAYHRRRAVPGLLGKSRRAGKTGTQRIFSANFILFFIFCFSICRMLFCILQRPTFFFFWQDREKKLYEHVMLKACINKHIYKCTPILAFTCTHTELFWNPHVNALISTHTHTHTSLLPFWFSCLHWYRVICALEENPGISTCIIP